MVSTVTLGLLLNQCSAPSQNTAWGDLLLCRTLSFLLLNLLRFLKPRGKTGFVFRHGNVVQLHVQGDTKASLIHHMEVVAHLDAFPPDLLLEKLQRISEGPKHPLSDLIIQPSGQ